MVSLEVVAIFLSGISISASLFYYANVLQNQNKTRQTQLFMQLFDRYSREFWRDGYELFQMEWTSMDDFFHKYDSSVNMDNFDKRYKLWSFFDGVGMLLKKGLVDVEMIYYLMGGYSVYWYWEKFKEVILESRVRLNSPDHLVMFEYLAGEMKKMKEEREHNLEIPKHWGDFTQDL